MKRAKILRIVRLDEKIVWLFIYCFILNMLLFYITHKLIRTGFINLFEGSDMNIEIDGADFTPIFSFAGLIINSFASVIFVVFTFVVNLLIFIITSVVFNILYFKTIALEKEIFFKCMKVIIFSFPFFGTILLIIINLKAFPVSFELACSHYLLFSSVSGIIIWIRIKEIYGNFDKIKNMTNQIQ